ncbi:MAG: transcription termination factor NusA [Sedimentisphaerales bacterium]|nr:transcription termination factor NusA [Sedimentisphaerales bacterium]MBN2843064.1 transcription termination factor NusA [Sedimentisphaerales bacterium]
MNQELLKQIEMIAREKNIDRDSIFSDIEAAMVSGIRKHFGTDEEFAAQIDRYTGEIQAFRNGEPLDIKKLGRIPAQTVKQVMIQRLREDERGSIFTEYQEKVGEIVSGSVTRSEGNVAIINLGRTEALLPKSEQIPGETHRVGERVRAIIYEVKEAPGQIKIILSRTHPDFILRLFEQEVPEVVEHTVLLKALAREAGYRTKVAVVTADSKIDAVGACVGVRGSRIKNIVEELNGEKIDIVRWNESSAIFIGNALKPADSQEIALCFELNRATVVVSDDQLSLAIGKRGQNVRLAARLTDWDIDILTPVEYRNNMENLVRTLRAVAEVDDTLIDKVLALGVVSVLDLEEIGPTPLVETLGIPEPQAVEMVKAAAVEASKTEIKTAAQAAIQQEND